MTPEEFVEKFLFPTFNNEDDIVAVDYDFGSSEIHENLSVSLVDGSEWTVAVTLRKP